MTQYLADVASYQGTLTVGQLQAAGFSIVNLKVSHGLTRKAVHPDVTGWVGRARAAGMGLSTFHWLTADATGADQAEFAYAQIAGLGLLYGTAHFVDVEADPKPSLTVVRDYLARMSQLLGRPVGLYTGDWWWPSGWDVHAEAPYLMAAPNRGYLSGYPGDSSADWQAGYGGWSVLSVMQYAVGSVAGTDVSKAAVRDPAAWHDLTRGRNGMSYAPTTLSDARKFILKTLPAMDPLSVGIVGDDAHAASGTSYHLGKDALKADSYSVIESPRDKAGLTNAAEGLDLGWFSVKVGGTTYDLRHYSAWVVRQCEAGAEDTLDIREIIYSLDGKTVKRWDRLKKRTTGDSSHTSHTHHSYFRDSESRDKTALFRRYFQEIGLIEGDDMNAAEMTAWAKSKDGKAALAEAVLTHDPGVNTDGSAKPGGVPNYASDAPTNPTITPSWALGRAGIAAIVAYQIRDKVDALTAAVAAILKNVQADDGETAQVLAALAEVKTSVPADVVNALGGAGMSDEDVAAALQSALGDRASAVGRILSGDQ